MFPDMMAPTQGYYVGVVLSAELPASDRALFRDLLSQMTDLRVQVCATAGDSGSRHSPSLKVKNQKQYAVLLGLLHKSDATTYY